MPVDETGRDREPLGVDLFGAALTDAAYAGDRGADDADVGLVGPEARSVDDEAVADHDVVARVARHATPPPAVMHSYYQRVRRLAGTGDGSSDLVASLYSTAP